MKLLDRIAGLIMGDRADTEDARPTFTLDMLSQYLPWRVFDDEKRIFINRNSSGFVLEIPPLVGADERTADILAQFFQEGLPKGACVQILSWGSPRIGRQIGGWFVPRYEAGPFYRHMGRKRVDHFFKGVWESLSQDSPFHLRHHRVIISVGVPDSSKISVSELVNVREQLVGTLKTLGIEAISFTPKDLIDLVDDLTSPTTAHDDDAVNYSELDPIADQAVRRDIELQIEPHKMLLRTERWRPIGLDDDGHAEIGEVYPDHFDVRHFSVRKYPERWTPWECSRLIGDLFADKLRFPCPVATFMCLEYPDEEASSAKAGYKSLRTTSLLEGRGAKFIPGLGEQAAEWRHVQDQLKEGRKLVKVFYGVTSYSPMGEGDRNERIVKAIYKSAGWDLEDARFLQIMGMLAALPLTLPDGLAVDLGRMKRFRTLLTSTAANMAPLQGEYLGSDVPHMLLVGRRGEPFYWSPFENKAGNHNVAVIGKSGSGKSVFIQELCAALCGAGAKVIVIDDGRSFMNSAKLQGGSFVEFTMSSGFGLNPFSMIDAERAAQSQDYKVDSMAMLKAIVGQMCRFIDRLNDTERGLIDHAVNEVWESHGSKGTIDAVASALNASGNAMAIDMAIALSPFCSSGTYGGFFNAPATMSLDQAFTVFELSDLGSREELRAVVLTAIMFLTSQMMTRMPRSVKKLLLIDEAWQLLKGGSMAEFVENYARTCRKYGGSLCTATQSMNDYHKSPGAKAALENSDWMVVLQQKPETIADIKASQRLEMDNATETLIRSLKRNGAEYSEMLIKGPEMQALARLCLDPWSAKVYSSSPEDFAEIERVTSAGYTIEEAIDVISSPASSREMEAGYARAAE